MKTWSGVSPSPPGGYRFGMPTPDEMKGRLKEAAGNLTDNKDLEREGKVDQGKGKVKEGVDKVGDKIKDAVTKD